MSMVPFADAFNHKNARVQLTGHYAVEPVCFDDSSTDVSGMEQADDGTSDSEPSGAAASGSSGKNNDSSCAIYCWTA